MWILSGCKCKRIKDLCFLATGVRIGPFAHSRLTSCEAPRAILRFHYPVKSGTASRSLGMPLKTSAGWASGRLTGIGGGWILSAGGIYRGQ